MIKAAAITPVIGVGGGDMFLAQLIRSTEHAIEWTGLAVVPRAYRTEKGVNRTTPRPAELYRGLRWSGRAAPVHVAGSGPAMRGVEYHDSDAAAIYAACRGADVIYTWGRPLSRDDLSGISGEIIEVVQGNDEWTRQGLACVHVDVRLVLVNPCIAGLLPKKYHESWTLIPNGIDPQRIYPSAPREYLRQRFEIPQDRRVLMIVQRLTTDKNAEAAIQAIAGLPEEWMLVACGAGDQDRFRKACARHAPGRVFVIGDPWSVHIGDLLGIADCFLLASESEGDSLAIHEAHLSGVPVVQTLTPSAAAWRQRFGDLSIYLPIDPSTSDLVNSVLWSQSDLIDIRRRAIDVTRTNFTMPAIAGRWLDLFADVAHEGIAAGQRRANGAGEWICQPCDVATR